MRSFLPGALQWKVAEAAEPQALLTCIVNNSPWADTGKVREWEVHVSVPFLPFWGAA